MRRYAETITIGSGDVLRDAQVDARGRGHGIIVEPGATDWVLDRVEVREASSHGVVLRGSGRAEDLKVYGAGRSGIALHDNPGGPVNRDITVDGFYVELAGESGVAALGAVERLTLRDGVVVAAAQAYNPGDLREDRGGDGITAYDLGNRSVLVENVKVELTRHHHGFHLHGESVRVVGCEAWGGSPRDVYMHSGLVVGNQNDLARQSLIVGISGFVARGWKKGIWLLSANQVTIEGGTKCWWNGLHGLDVDAESEHVTVSESAFWTSATLGEGYDIRAARGKASTTLKIDEATVKATSRSIHP